MIANYHTHTWRCNHATGTEEEYIEHAMANGIRILGFSDHTPYLFPDGYYSGFRMKPDQLVGYVQTVLELKEKYKDRIEIHLGLETEYYPALFPATLEFLRESGMEYLILGQHVLGNEINDFYSGRENQDEELLSRYCCQVQEAMNTGVFTYLAHPDLFRYTGDKKVYQQYMREICREANSCRMPVEINLLGLAEQRHYPNPLFWEVAAEENCRVVLGRDAHEPEAFDDQETEEKAVQMAKELGLNLLSTVELKPIQ